MHRLDLIPARKHFVHGVRALMLVSLLGVSPAWADVATRTGEKKKERSEKEEKKKEREYLPEAHSVALRFVAGQPVTIELSGAVGVQQQVEFLIRQAPQYGALSAIIPHPTDTSRATVLYKHSDPNAPLMDNFTYACRVPGGSWSAPATVTLVGQRMEPRIEILEHPTYGRIFLGEEKTAKVRVRNVGTAPLSMPLVWEAPWKGPPTLEVPLGGVEEFYVSFTPTKAGEFHKELLLQPGIVSSRMVFYGDCILPFTVTPSRLELQFKESTGERSGVISLVNSRNEKSVATLTLPAGLEGPASVELAPGSKTEVRVWLPATKVTKFGGKIEVASGESSVSVDISAGPTPAAMKLVSPGREGLDFGRVTPNSSFIREVEVANRGGEPLVLEVRTSPPFVLEGTREAATLAPLEQRAFKIKVSGTSLGPHSGTVSLISGSGRIELPLTVEVVEPPPPIAAPSTDKVRVEKPVWPPIVADAKPLPVPAAKAAPAAPASPAVVGDPVLAVAKRNKLQQAVLVMLASRGVSPPRGSINTNLEQVQGLAVQSSSTSEVVLTWNIPGVMPAGWAIEQSGMAFQEEHKVFAKVWSRYDNWKLVGTDSGKVSVRLFGLKPASQNEFRVMGLDREGKISEPSEPLVASTNEPWRVPAWAWRLLIVAALGTIAYVLFRVRRGDFLAEA